MAMSNSTPAALARFIANMDSLVGNCLSERDTIGEVRVLLAELVRQDYWLSEQYAQPDPVHYQQYLLHGDPLGRYSVVSFVWGPGQKTPVHDHGVWGVIGMLRGEEVSQAWTWKRTELVAQGAPERLHPGDVAAVSPSIGDIHQVSNGLDDRVSISIHVYGSDIGRQKRHVYDVLAGTSKSFVSGYANAAEVQR